MTVIPNRRSLVVQAAEVIRQEIARGRWRDFLPGQRALCDWLQVSRTTLEPALAALQRQGLIRIAHGRRTRLVPRSGGAPVSGVSRRVVVLIYAPIYALSQYAFFNIMELQRHLTAAGFELEIRFDAHLCVPKVAPKRLASLVRETPAAAWILFSMNHGVQRWFMDQGLPVLLSGSAHADIRLPSLDVHREAVFRHAAGKFLKAGHRHVALLVPRSDMAGDLAGERGFRAAFEAGEHGGAVGYVVRYDGTVDGARTALGPVLAANPAVTGVLVAYPKIVLSVMGHLQAAGKRIPREVSIISADFEEFLGCQVPSVAYYRYDAAAFASRLSRLARELAETGFLPVRAHRLMADFQSGASFGPGRV